MAYVGKKPVDVIDLTKSNSFDVTTSVTVGGDIAVGDDINMTSDGAQISFGADNDVTLTHNADLG